MRHPGRRREKLRRDLILQETHNLSVENAAADFPISDLKRLGHGAEADCLAHGYRLGRRAWSLNHYGAAVDNKLIPKR